MYPVKFKTRIDRLPHLLNMHYIEIPERIIKKLGGKYSMRLMCTVNSSLTFQGGIVALGEGRGYISINTRRMKQIGVVAGDTVSIELNKDDSKYGMEIPEELSTLLEQDPEGKKRFDNLTPGRQRYIIHYVSSVKSVQLRIDRAILLITNLKKLPPGKENFREMLGLPPR
jgi:hypothetical protein